MTDLEAAAAAIREARTLHVGTGAGMGVDSGLPDFRGAQGFWNAYPPYAHLGLSFSDMANPRWFSEDPELAWGFYGHRLGLYRTTQPHGGFDILLRWGQERALTVFTSNVDGQFQIAGFAEDTLYEVHGSIHYLQCSRPCGPDVWACDVDVEVDTETFRAVGDLPRCRACGALARPNILMFGDWSYQGTRQDAQAARYSALVASAPGPAVVVEIGAGTAVPTVRYQSERLQRRGATLVRINPREFDGPAGTLSVRLGGLEALQQLDGLL